jgi:hypothetical protein
MLNIAEIIKNDHVLSAYDFEMVYVIIRRMIDLGYIQGDGSTR